MKKIKRVLYPSGYNPYYLDGDWDRTFSTLQELKSYYGFKKLKKSGKGFASTKKGKFKKWDEYEVIE